MRSYVLVIGLLLFGSDAVHAGSLTYAFSGVADASPFAPIPAGTPFDGTFTIDTAAVGQPVPPFTTSYPQSIPPANLTVNVAGLTVQSIADGIVRLSTSGVPGVNKFSEAFETTTFTGTGWSYTPSDGTSTPQVAISLSFNGTLPADLTQLPTFDGSNPTRVHIGLSPGLYVFPGGTLNVSSEFVWFDWSVTSISIVPEPSTIALAAFGLLALVGVAVRRRS